MVPILIPIVAHRKPLQKQSSFLLLQSKSIWIIAETPVSGLAWGRMIDWRRYQMKGTQDISTMSGLIRGINSAAASTWKMQKAPFFSLYGDLRCLRQERDNRKKILEANFCFFHFKESFLFLHFFAFKEKKRDGSRSRKRSESAKFTNFYIEK